MGFVKQGVADGKVLEQADGSKLAKLGAKLKCKVCGQNFPVVKVSQFVYKKCSKCEEQSGQD